MSGSPSCLSEIVRQGKAWSLHRLLSLSVSLSACLDVFLVGCIKYTSNGDDDDDGDDGENDDDDDDDDGAKVEKDMVLVPPMGDPPTHPFSKSQNYRTISEQASASLKTEIGQK